MSTRPGAIVQLSGILPRTPEQPFKDKPVAVLGAAVGVLGTARAQYDLRRVLVCLEALIMNRPEVFVGAANQKFDAAGTLTDDTTREFLGLYMKAVAAWVDKVG